MRERRREKRKERKRKRDERPKEGGRPRERGEISPPKRGEGDGYVYARA